MNRDWLCLRMLRQFQYAFQNYPLHSYGIGSWLREGNAEHVNSNCNYGHSEHHCEECGPLLHAVKGLDFSIETGNNMYSPI
ncbi:hypothetical protein CEXT_289631 [Caerostris extrusa]|uniref:Uncharacterized protein n=1 Tax=Caerostris extrusa TaxID=172846 RepID=A0AAV4N0C4_CAEEX|nr:hypothetical protein CEXT_289631 [Caerostris extrusa]